MKVGQAELADFHDGKYDPPKSSFDRWMDLNHQYLDPIRHEMSELGAELGEILGETKPARIFHRGFSTYNWTELSKRVKGCEDEIDRKILLTCIRENLEANMRFQVEMERVDLMDVMDRTDSGEEQAMTWEEAVSRVPDFAACVARDPKMHDGSLKNIEGIRKWLEKQRW